MLTHSVTPKIRKVVRKLATELKHKVSHIHPAPVIVLGNQKSGTSAIAGLLAKATDKSVRIDMFHLIKDDIKEKLYSGTMDFESFIKKHKFYFSSEIIKECNFTFFYEDLRQLFPQSTFIYVMRDPRDNIRSILNRLKIPGNLEQLNEAWYEKLRQSNNEWTKILDGYYPVLPGENYIERLAYRWNRATDIYLSNKDSIELIRYDEFVKDKDKSIVDLATKINFETPIDISPYVDFQFQPKGDKNVTWLEFFGRNNLHRIERICASHSCECGYSCFTV